MSVLKKIGIGILFVLLGGAIGSALLFVFSYTLRFDHPLLARFGVRKPEIIGFLPYWLLDANDTPYGRYVTTLAYFGLSVDVDGKPIYLANPGEEEPGWTALKGDAWETVKTRAGNVKVSLLVHSADEDVIAGLIESPEETARALVLEVGPLMEKRGFTDLNLDIESFSEASAGAREKFTQFIRTAVIEAKRAGVRTVTVEIPPIALFTSNIADPVAIGAIADRVVLMTYDYHYSGSFQAGPVAPVGGAPAVREFDVTMAIEEAVRQIPKDKIILGIPLYGYEWETIEEKPGSATIPGGASTASSKRVALLLAECASCSAHIDPVSKQPFIIYRDNNHYQQIYFENAASLSEKIALAKTYGLGGVALWALGYEDDALLRPLEAYRNTVDWRPLKD